MDNIASAMISAQEKAKRAEVEIAYPQVNEQDSAKALKAVILLVN